MAQERQKHRKPGRPACEPPKPSARCDPGVALEDDGPPIEQTRVRVLPDGRLDRRNAALFLGRAVGTLADWHKHRTGPPSVLINGRRFYYLADLRAFVARGQEMRGGATLGGATPGGDEP